MITSVVNSSILNDKANSKRVENLRNAPNRILLDIYQATLKDIDAYLDTSDLRRLTSKSLAIIRNDLLEIISGIRAIPTSDAARRIKTIDGVLEELRLARDLIQVALGMFDNFGQIDAKNSKKLLSELRLCRSQIAKANSLFIKPSNISADPSAGSKKKSIEKNPNKKTQSAIERSKKSVSSSGGINEPPSNLPENLSVSDDDSLPEPNSSRPARQSHLIQSGNTRIDVYFGGNPPTLVLWELNVEALVLPVGTLGSLTGRMAESFLEAIGQQSQNFLHLFESERSKRKSTSSQSNLSHYIEPETPILIDTKGSYPKIKSRYIIAATAYRRANSQALTKSQQQIEDESQDTLQVINAGDAAEAIIRLAAENKITSLAIPLLGTGVAGLPSIEVAQDMAATIREAVVGTSIQQVILLTRDWGAYNSLVSLIQPKPQKTINDLSEGDDKLRVKAEIDALADTLLLSETETPLAVGILGGWGGGKSFVMHMLHERMAEIRAMAASDEYVGHPYLIDFDAWTYAKSNLWSSLMQTIFLELNRQIEREKKLAPGVEAADIEKARMIYPGTRGFTGKVKIGDEILWDQLREFRSAEHVELKRQEKLLDQKRAELEKKHKDAIEEVDIQIQKEMDEAVWQPLLKALTKPFGKSWKRIFSGNEIRDPQAFRSWFEFSAFLLFALVSFIVPLMFGQFKQFQFPGILLAVGAFIVGIMRTFDKWKVDVDEIRRRILASRDKRIKEKTEEEKDKFERIEREIKEQELKVLDARRLAGVTATFDSLLELCQARLRQSDYENELGLMHRVKLDLDEMDWALNNAIRKSSDNQPVSFPRGKPRIILFIDDLDRCPPQRVVEVLEATQLLLKTELFVIVLAMDTRYVTRALEKAYEGILERQGNPSGLDYIEKIIQIPYQVRPVDPQVVDGYVSSMMSIQSDDLESKSATNITGNLEIHLADMVLNSTASVSDSKNQMDANSVRKPRTLSSLSQVVAFSKAEYDFLVVCCQQVNLTPRAIKRLVNVYKLLKILWSREPRWPHPEAPVEQAIVLLLTLSCSYPDAMREAFEELESEIRNNKLGIKQSQNLADFFAIDHSINRNKNLVDEWRRLQGDLKSLWAFTNDNKNWNVKALKDLPLEKMSDVLPLVHSFSFVSDLGS